MSSPKSRLYELLPTYLRFRDQQLRDPELGVAPLEALIKTLEMPLHAIEENIDALYQGWFIETCDEWKVPYLADLLGIRGLDEAGAMIPSQRARVANTIAYRRRKGTPAALARAAEGATGWPCYAAELRHMTGVSQALGSPRPEHGATLDLRDDPSLGEIGRAFDRHTHSADLKQPRPGRPSPPGSGFQPDNLGLTFWRLESYPVCGGIVRPSQSDPERCYRFHPSGVDSPLFNLPQTLDATVAPVSASNLPIPLGRRGLAREIAARRRGESPKDGLLGRSPAFRIRVRYGPDEEFREIPPQQIDVCDLSDWEKPHPGPDWERATVAVDPETGRLVFPGADPTREIQVDFCYAAVCDVGGGPYPRRERLADPATVAWQAIVDRDPPVATAAAAPRLAMPHSAVPHFKTLAEALDAWRQAVNPADPQATAPREALIEIADSGWYDVGELEIDLPADRRLTIQAAQRAWPHLEGAFVVRGEAGSRLQLDGLGIEGGVTLRGRPALSLRHCTLHPPAGQGIALDYPPAAAGSRRFEVVIEHSILTGAIRLPMPMLGLAISDSIVDAGGPGARHGGEGGGHAIRGTEVLEWTGEPPERWIGPPARIQRSTIFGDVSVLQLWQASNALFTGPVVANRPREGEARFSYFPSGSVTPPRRNCLEEREGSTGCCSRPAFTSTTYGQPGYAQLSPCCVEILNGGEQGNEIGVYHHLRQSNRMANLAAVLDEFLPAGFTPRISFAN